MLGRALAHRIATAIALGATAAGALAPGVWAARTTPRRVSASAGSIEFVNFRYLGVSRSQHGLLMQLRTETQPAHETSIRLESGTSKKVLVKRNVGTITHSWRRFVVRVHGKAPRRGEYQLEVFQGSTYSATFFFTVR